MPPTLVAEADIQKAVEIHCGRWDYMFTDIMAAGYLLDPEYWDIPNKAEDEEVMSGFYRMVDRTYPVDKEPPADAPMPVRATWTTHKEQQVASWTAAVEQLSLFENKQGLFGRPEALDLAKSMPACAWWRRFGSSAPKLMKVAVRCLAQVGGAGAAERGHKEMNFIKSKSRNRMGSKRLDDLIYIRVNMNTTENVTAIDYSGPKIPRWVSETGDQEAEEGGDVQAGDDGIDEDGEEDAAGDGSSTMDRYEETGYDSGDDTAQMMAGFDDEDDVGKEVMAPDVRSLSELEACWDVPMESIGEWRQRRLEVDDEYHKELEEAKEDRVTKGQERFTRMKNVKGLRIVPAPRQLDEHKNPVVGSTRTSGRVRRPAICSDAFEIPAAVRRNMAS